MQRAPREAEREYARDVDTYLLEDGVRGLSGRAALEIGTGSGYVTKTLEESFEIVVGTDINFGALAGQTYPCSNAVCCDGADALRGGFELVACNMPYVPTDTVEVRATDGGRGGVEVPLHIMRSAMPRVARGGRFVYVTSSLSRPHELEELARSAGFAVRTLRRKRLFFEELLLVEAARGEA